MVMLEVAKRDLPFTIEQRRKQAGLPTLVSVATESLRPEIPDDCTVELAALIMNCW